MMNFHIQLSGTAVGEELTNEAEEMAYALAVMVSNLDTPERLASWAEEVAMHYPDDIVECAAFLRTLADTIKEEK